MRTYRRVVDFKYKKKKYSMFIDNMSKYYFLGRKDDGSYKYIDIDEYVELLNVFTKPTLIRKVKKNGQKMKIIPKILIGGLVTSITLGSNALTAKLVSNYKDKVYQAYFQDYKDSLAKRYGDIPTKEDTIMESISVEETESLNETTAEDIPEETTEEYDKHKLTFDVVDSDEDLEVDTYLVYKYARSIYVYDSENVRELFGDEEITLDDFNKVIDANSNIPDSFKGYVKRFCKDLIEKQPKAERRILYENLKDLSIVEYTDMHQLSVKTLSWDALACYVRSENTIYTMKEYQYQEGTWDFQILYHELAHAARSRWNTWNGYKLRIQADGSNFYDVIIEEALNSVFAVSLFDYEEKDIAYQLQSNIIKLLVDNMDNYEISDYMNHSMSYFCHKLDEFHGDHNYGAVLLKLVETQYEDFHDPYMEIDKEEYYPIYEYLSDFYYKNRINENTTYEEAQGYTAELLNKVLYDVPSEYNIDTAYFYTYLDEYCKKIGLNFDKQKTP